MINVVKKLRNQWFLVFTGFLLALFATPSVHAAVDTSSCDGMGEKRPAQIISKQTCYSHLARSSKDVSVCSGAPDPNSCIGYVAAELDSPELITANLEGEAREMAMAIYAGTKDPDALDLIQDNRMHDYAVILLVGTSFVTGQVDVKMGMAVPKKWCNAKLRGFYEGFEGYNDAQVSLIEEFHGMKNICNEFAAITRELAYGDESCDNWLASVYRGLVSLEKLKGPARAMWEENPSMMSMLDTPENVVSRCNEGVEKLRSILKKAGFPEIIVNSEEEAWKELGIEKPAAPKTWELVGGSRVNPKKEMRNFAGGGALDWWFPEERYKGKTLDYTVSETSMTMADHHMDDGDEYINVEFTATFKKPPSILTEGEKIDLSATVSGGGSVTRPRGSGITFEYSADGVGLQNNSAISVDLAFQRKSVNPSFIVPKPKAEGKITIKARLWNCPACVVEWVYLPQDTSVPFGTHIQPIIGPESDEWFDELLAGVEGRVPPPEKKWRILDVSGGVLIKHKEGGSDVATVGTDLSQWDTIITYPDSRVRLGFVSGDPDMPAVVNIGEDAEVYLKDFETYKDWKPEQRGFIALIKGAVRALTKGWDHNSVFSIKAGTDLAKGTFSDKAGIILSEIRGSEVLICNDPASKKVHAYVLEGHMDVSNTETGEIKSLTNNQKVVVQNGILGDIQTLSQNERGIFTAGKKVSCDFVEMTSSVIPDFIGQPLRKAREWLKDNNLMVRLKPGSTAPSPELSGAVEDQAPKAGTTLKKGEKVSLTVHSAFVDVSKVPDITGMKLADAKEALRKQGLESKLRPGGPAPSRDRSGTIESQHPAAGSTVEKGAQITLHVHSKYVENRTVPGVSGLSASRAKSRIAEAGLTPVLRPGEAASSQKQTGTVTRQKPAAGTTVKPGSEVEIFIYGPYVAKTLPPRKEQISDPRAEEETSEDWIIGSEWGHGKVAVDLKYIRLLPGRMKFVKEGNRLIAIVMEEFSGNYCPQAGGICYEITRKAGEKITEFEVSTYETRTFIARRFMKNGQSGFVFLEFGKVRDRSGARENFYLKEGDLENENDYHPGKLSNPTTWVWAYRGRSSREPTDSPQPSGRGTSHDGELKDEPIDAIGTLGQ